MLELVIKPNEFEKLRALLHSTTGIALTDNKVTLVQSRLANHLNRIGYKNFSAYLDRITSGDKAEFQTLVNLLTTNETYFFREPKHFDFLKEIVSQRSSHVRAFRIWSAACSSGEEPYTLAMTLMEAIGKYNPWEIVASDISSKVMEQAKSAHYPLERSKGIPQELLKKYCLRGIRQQQGSFMILPELKSHVIFRAVNLVEALPDDLGIFDVIFLRNVMIYFDIQTKNAIVSSMVQKLRPGGYFIISHAECLPNSHPQLESVRPSIYRKLA